MSQEPSGPVKFQQVVGDLDAVFQMDEERIDEFFSYYRPNDWWLFTQGRYLHPGTRVQIMREGRVIDDVIAEPLLRQTWMRGTRYRLENNGEVADYTFYSVQPPLFTH